MYNVQICARGSLSVIHLHVIVSYQHNHKAKILNVRDMCKRTWHLGVLGVFMLDIWEQVLN